MPGQPHSWKTSFSFLARRLFNIGKWLWLAGILFFTARYLVLRGNFFWQAVTQVPWPRLAAAWLGLAAAKMLLVSAMDASVRQVRFRLTWPRCFQVYNYTQLAKYIPGSIWQFVGKAGFYSQHGMQAGQVRDALVLETVSEPFGACVTAGIFLLGTRPAGLSLFFQAAQKYWLPALAGLALLFGWGLWRLQGRLWSWKLLRFLFLMLGIQLGIWLSLGLSFDSLLAGFNAGHPGQSIGLFAAAYVVGFLVPVAPAGLGVRESMLVLGLQPLLPAETAWAVAGMHRVLFVLTEIALAIAAWSLGRLPGLSSPANSFPGKEKPDNA